jgi:hypothetical protein
MLLIPRTALPVDLPVVTKEQAVDWQTGSCIAVIEHPHVSVVSASRVS